ncbi:MAG: hydroxymethylbilane synthase, partial [Shewanella sp.]
EGVITGPKTEAKQLGIALAEELLSKGAKKILDAVYATA